MKRSVVRAKRRFSVLERDGFRCVYCGKSAFDGVCLSVAFHEDHVYPRSLGGSDGYDNLVSCCSDCNIGKGNRVLKRLPAGISPDVKQSFDGLGSSVTNDSRHGGRLLQDGSARVEVCRAGDATPVCSVTHDFERVALFIYSNPFCSTSRIHREVLKNRDKDCLRAALNAVASIAAFSRKRVQTKGRPTELWWHNTATFRFLNTFDEFGVWHAIDPETACATLNESLERYAAAEAARNAARRIKTARLPTDVEGALLERLVAERRRSQSSSLHSERTR